MPQKGLKDFPFQSHFHKLPGKDSLPPQSLHYIDEGRGDVVLLVHGNPTWSFYFRKLIFKLKKNFRVISIDHLGMGLSSKPQTNKYSLCQHIENLSHFVGSVIGDKSLHLVVHDWGGAIGLGWATQNLKALNKLVVMNSAAFPSFQIPKRILFCRLPLFGDFFIRYLNGFARPAVTLACNKPLTKEAKLGLLFPYKKPCNRTGIARFVQDIPLSKKSATHKLLADIEKKIPLFKGEALLTWGLKDFCFNKKFLYKWQSLLPAAGVKIFAEAGHYLLEDEPEKVSTDIDSFLRPS